MVAEGIIINDGTMLSLKKAIREGNIYFFEKEQRPEGFFTWRYDDGELKIDNLCMFEGKKVNLLNLRKFFHDRYPELKKVKWINESKNEKPFEVNF